jgi:hypothetical protein
LIGLRAPSLTRNRNVCVTEDILRKSHFIHLCVLAFVLSRSGRVCPAQFREGKLGPAIGSRPSGQAARDLDAASSPRTLIGMQYETYFFRSLYLPGFDPGSGETAEAVPLLGKYNSYDVNVIKKHEEWFEYLGIDWLLIDWSNMLSMKPAWEEHSGATRELEETTALLFKTYTQLQREGKRPPKLVIMLGLQGPPHTMVVERLNRILAWMHANLLDKPEYKNLWLYYHGKPLLTVLALTTCGHIGNLSKGFAASDWTVRWMGSQLQDTHADDCGFWSWMDGPIRQKVTYKDGIAEETVVTPASFPISLPDATGTGWLDAHAVGRDHGAPYLESWRVAFESRPKFIQIHQWNEFAGQKHPRTEAQGRGSKHIVYGDEYNQELSDDIEPTRLDACTNSGCGGWGYYYVNLTKALISLYRNQTPDITVMALSGPSQPGVVKEKQWPLTWKSIGTPPSSYTLRLDGKSVAENIQGERYMLDLSKVAPGKHRVTLLANGVHTYFDLAPERLTQKSNAPLPVMSTIELTYAPSHH